MRNRLPFLLLLLALQQGLFAQTPSPKDSLLQLITTSKKDTGLVKSLVQLTRYYSNKNYDSFYYYIHEADTLARTLNWTGYDFYIYAGYAEYYYHTNDYNKAIAAALNGRDYAEKAHDQKLLAKSYNNLAAVYNQFGHHRNAIEAILKCLAISELTKDSLSFPIRNLTASNTYFNLNQFDKTIEYARKAIAYGKQFGNDYAILMGMNNLSAAYSSLNQLDSSILINQRQLALAKEQEDVVNINYALVNLCYDNFKTGNTAALAAYAKELQQSVHLLPDDHISSDVANALALHYIAQRQFENAKAQLDSGIHIAQQDNDPDELSNLYHTYAVFYYLQGKTKEGETYSYRYDSISNATNLKELSFYAEELETKYNTEKKEAQIKNQQLVIRQKNRLNIVLLLTAVTFLVMLALAWWNYKTRRRIQQQRINELETEKQLSATEAVLKGEEQERSRLAKDLHDGLGGMLSGIKYSLRSVRENLVMTPDNTLAFERSMDMLDSSIREMRRVAHNMMPEMLLKYGLNTALKDFCNEIDRSGVVHITYQSIGMQDVHIEQTTAVTIYRVVMELVNNAIKHSSAQNVLVQVHVSEQEKILTLTVEDNGTGFDKSILQSSPGIGWSNIQNRIEFLKGKIDVQSEPGKGSSVFIEISL